MTKLQESLADKAASAGFTVKQKGSTVIIFKMNKRGQVKQGLEIEDTGYAFDMTVMPEMQKAIRNRAEMAQLLGLGN